ncbi:hypothetical protein NEAUS06_2102 [Nematocida ausubeli]|nr:hypothetical protein NEAUS06_2102 [Nematocida ausubeli]
MDTQAVQMQPNYIEESVPLEMDEGPPTDAATAHKTTLRERISCALLGIVLYFMDILTIGAIGLGNISGMDLPKYSKVMFLIGICSSQIIFFLFSSFTIGVITTPISENFVTIAGVTEALSQVYKLEGSTLFWTLLVFIAISTLMTSFVFFILYVTGFQKILSKVPAEIGIALFFVIGCFCCIFGNASSMKIADKMSSEIARWSILVMYNGLALVSWGVAKLIARKFPKIGPFSYGLVLFALIGLSYIPILGVWGSIANARKSEFLPPGGKSFFILFDLPLMMEFGLDKVAWSCIFTFDMLLKMASIVIINLVQFPVNMPAISTGCRVAPSLKKELLANSVSNLFSSVFGGFSTYVVSSSTIALNKGGPITKKIDGLMSVVCFLALYLVGQTAFSYVPQICLDMLLLFIGFDILMDSVIGIWSKGLYTIIFSSAVAIPCLYLNNLPIGMAVGFGISLLVYLRKLQKQHLPLFKS